MDPIPTMVIETTAATKKGRIEVGLDGIAELRAQLDKAERGLLAAKAAMDADEPEDAGWPAPCPACGQRDEHADDCERDAQLAAIGERVQALSEPGGPSGPPPQVLAKMAARGMAELTAPRTAEMVPLDEGLPWATQPGEACGWSGPDGDHCLLKPHGPRVAHAAPIGAGSMRRWPALRSVTA